jgi:protein AbiQ
VEVKLDKLKLYIINDSYIEYLRQFDSKVIDNKDNANRKFDRKYIGIVFEINNFKYFAPLSSFKPKHENMKENIDLIKIGKMAVINLNNMIPIPKSQVTYCDIEAELDVKYKDLLRNEYAIISKKSIIIITRAKKLYSKVTEYNSFLAKRCCDFKLLENKCFEFSKNNY